MPQAVAELYNTLTLSAQQEVYDFMMYLVQKQEKLEEAKKKEYLQKSEENDYSLEKAVSDSRSLKNLYGPFDSAQAAVASMLED